MTDAASSSFQVPLDANGAIAAHTACLTCGYDLYGLPLEAPCPECGTPVRISCDDFLRFAEPDWVRSRASGLKWIIASVCTGVTTYLIVILVLMAMAMSLMGPPSTRSVRTQPPPELQKATYVTSLIALAPFGATAVLFIVGLRRLATPAFERDMDQDPDLAGGAKAIRFSNIAMPIGTVISLTQGLLFLLIIGAPMGSQAVELAENWWYAPLAIFGMVVGVAAFAIPPFAVLAYGGRLMKRIPNAGMAKFAAICFWGLLVCGAIVLTVQAASIAVLAVDPSMATASGGQSPFMMLIGCGSILGGCPGAGFAIAAFVCLILMATALSKAAREAELNADAPRPA